MSVELVGRAHAVATLLRGYRYACSSEAQLQEAIATVLTQEGYAFRREKAISRKDRPDFMLDGGLAIEVKTEGSLSPVLRQLSRYAEQEAVRAIVLVTTRATHARVPDALCGKPVVLVHIVGALA